MNFPKKLMTKLIIQNNYLFRIFLPSFFHEAYKSKIPQKKTYSKNICVCTVCDNNYIPGLIILIESILEYNYWFNLPFYIFMDSDKKINSKTRVVLTTYLTGILPDIPQIKLICDENNISLH